MNYVQSSFVIIILFLTFSNVAMTEREIWRERGEGGGREGDGEGGREGGRERRRSIVVSTSALDATVLSSRPGLGMDMFGVNTWLSTLETVDLS